MAGKPPLGCDSARQALAERAIRMEESGRQMLPAMAGEVLALVRRALGEELIAAYVYGSAVAGGLRPSSDLDILAVTSRPIGQGRPPGDDGHPE